MSFYITKASGEQQLFDENKFKKSLERAGAHDDIIARLLENIKLHPELRSTKEIYRWALNTLKKEHLPTAARYNLKQALLQLGPTGFPFEQFIAHVMRAQGYSTQTNQIITGQCVSHEIDLIFFNHKTYNFAECKFHNRQGLTTSIHVPLYIKARYDDVYTQWKSLPEHHKKKHHAWVITNTRFTTEAIKYGTCVGLKLVGWAYPEEKGLRDLVDRFGVHPITALTTLNTKQKKELIANNFLLCRDVHKHIGALQALGISDGKLDTIIAEAEGVCKL